jgi:hypothetical protein
MGNNGKPLSDGSADLHYALTSVPSGSGFGAGDYVVNQNSSCFSNGWFHDSTSSKWIGPVADQDSIRPGSAVEGVYIYRTTFDLTGFDPKTAFIAGQWATDNTGVDVLINGKSTGITYSTRPYTLTRFTISAGFQSGLNTLEFVVNNALEPNPKVINATGLRVELSGAAEQLDLSRSTMTVAARSIPRGGATTITLIARDTRGNQLTTGGLSFNFSLASAAGSGSFSNLVDHGNGTYTAIFTATASGSVTITATLNGQSINSSLSTITITDTGGAGAQLLLSPDIDPLLTNVGVAKGQARPAAQKVRRV